jgi:hypothetical protein
MRTLSVAVRERLGDARRASVASASRVVKANDRARLRILASEQ